MNCREFLIEFENRLSLTETATLHLNGCPDCQKTSSEQTRVWQMIDGLNQVGAPKDFDFRVKARIANARPTDFQPRFLPVLRYVLPLSVVVLLVGLFAFNTFYSSNKPQMAESKIAAPIGREDLPTNTALTNQLAFTKEELPAANTKPSEAKKVVAMNPSPKSTIKTPFRIIKEDIGGSRISTFKSATVFTPENFNPNQTAVSTSNSEDKPPISVEQIGEFLGIEIVLENGKRRIKSVIQNSLAGRSGIKVGDIIDELNGKKLSIEQHGFKMIELKTLTVLRGSERIEIILDN